MNSEVDRHGTNMAGLIASHPNNSICSVGVAYDVNLGIDLSTSGLKGYYFAYISIPFPRILQLSAKKLCQVRMVVPTL